MRHSESIAAISAAMAKAQGEIKNAIKSEANPFFKSKYADLASIRDACQSPLAQNGIAVFQSPAFDGKSVVITTLLAHSSGEWIEGDLTLIPIKTDPQSLGSTITYGRRYALGSMVGVAPEDDDGNLASGKDVNERGTKEAAKTVASRKIEEMKAPPPAMTQDLEIHPSEPVATKMNQPEIPQPVQDIWARMVDVKSVVAEFQDLKREFHNYMGPEKGEATYRATLAAFGGKTSSNEFRKFPEARQCALMMWKQIKEIERQMIEPKEGNHV